MSLPSGTVTFLFTDIGGSARLWEEYPEAMKIALFWHNVLVEQAIKENSGRVFKTVGDAFCAACHAVPDAVNAAFNGQQALNAEVLSQPVTIKLCPAIFGNATICRRSDLAYWVYQHWAAEQKAVIHSGQCGYCCVYRVVETTFDAAGKRRCGTNLACHNLAPFRLCLSALSVPTRRPATRFCRAHRLLRSARAPAPPETTETRYQPPVGPCRHRSAPRSP
jgi:hypothetical protein